MVPLDVLRQVRFLQDLPDDYLNQVAGIAEIRDLAPGTAVFREGEKAVHVFVVLQGRVALEISAPGRGPVQFQTVGPGELLGWSPMRGTGTMTASARVVIPTKLIALHGRQLAALGEHNPKLGMELMRRTALALAQRLNATRLQLLDVYRNELPVAAGEGGMA